MGPKTNPDAVILDALARAPNLTLGEAGTTAPLVMNEQVLTEQARPGWTKGGRVVW